MNIRHLELQTNRLEELKTFYVHCLGLPLQKSTGESFTVRIGESLLQFTKALSGTKPFYHFAFNIPENQLQEALSWLRERVEILASADGTEVFDFAHWDAHAFYFLDPAGNILECITRHGLPNATEAPFTVASLLNISEIGLPVDAPLEFCASVNRELGIPPFFRSVSSDQFATSGDDHGLLIVVPKTKKWMPTDTQVQTFPVRVQMDGNEPAVLKEEEVLLEVIPSQLIVA